MKVGDLIKIKSSKRDKTKPVALVIKKYDIADYWMVQPLGEEGYILIHPEDTEVISENRNTRKK